MVLEDLDDWKAEKKVMIDMEIYREIKDNPPWIKIKEPWKSLNQAVGYISRCKEDDEKYLIVSSRENNVDGWNARYARGDLVEEAVTPLECKICGSDLIYHDKLEEYICPFCKEATR